MIELNCGSQRKLKIGILALAVGIFLRFFVMSLGHNYDFESYCIVGDIASHFRNVYEETGRYNYGPVFFVILGAFYRIARLFPDTLQPTFRILIVSLLTMGDLGIAAVIHKRSSAKQAILFFLNPMSVIITGFHNQFDNLAILLALISLDFYNNEKEFSIKDMFFVVFFSLSLIMKHILFMIPFFIIMKKELPTEKKLLYAFVPPILFLISFLPFALHSTAAFDGIKQNVFLYKSFNNMPLFQWLPAGLEIPRNLRFPLFIILMIITAIFTRRRSFEYTLMVYLIAIVAFSSAVTNQYLIIPLAAIFCLGFKILDKAYLLIGGVYLLLEGNGLHQSYRFSGWLAESISKFIDHAYMILSFILFAMLTAELIWQRYDFGRQTREAPMHTETTV